MILMNWIVYRIQQNHYFLDTEDAGSDYWCVQDQGTNDERKHYPQRLHLRDESVQWYDWKGHEFITTKTVRFAQICMCYRTDCWTML